jgi:hypothetical protein
VAPQSDSLVLPRVDFDLVRNISIADQSAACCWIRNFTTGSSPSVGGNFSNFTVQRVSLTRSARYLWHIPCLFYRDICGTFPACFTAISMARSLPVLPRSLAHFLLVLPRYQWHIPRLFYRDTNSTLPAHFTAISMAHSLNNFCRIPTMVY